MLHALQKLTESKKQVCPFSTQKVSMSKPKREREREIDNLYWQDSAEERQYNIYMYYTVSGCSHLKAAWVDLFEISPALKILPNYFPGCGSWRDLRMASSTSGSTTFASCFYTTLLWEQGGSLEGGSSRVQQIKTNNWTKSKKYIKS